MYAVESHTVVKLTALEPVTTEEKLLELQRPHGLMVQSARRQYQVTVLAVHEASSQMH